MLVLISTMIVLQWIETSTPLAVSCGSGPHWIPSRSDSEPWVIYQRQQKTVVLRINDSVNSYEFNERKPKFTKRKLDRLVDGHTFSKSGGKQLIVNVTQELDGLTMAYNFSGSTLARSSVRSSWIRFRVGADPKIVLNQRSPHVVHSHSSDVQMCGRVFGDPLPEVTLLRSSDQTKLSNSLYTYDGRCWTFNTSTVDSGGQFTILASNCWSSTNASFTIEVKPTMELRLGESSGCLWEHCNPLTTRLLVLTGQDVVIPYDIRGFPVPTLRCKKYSKKTRQYTTSHDCTLNITHVILRNVTLNHSGIYRIRLKNDVRSDKVIFRLMVTTTKELVNACLTDSVTRNSCPSSKPTPDDQKTNNYVSERATRRTTLRWPTVSGGYVRPTDTRRTSGYGPTKSNVNDSHSGTDFITAAMTSTVWTDDRDETSQSRKGFPHWITGAACAVFLVSAIGIIALSCRVVKKKANKIPIAKEKVEEQPRAVPDVLRESAPSQTRGELKELPSYEIAVRRHRQRRHRGRYSHGSPLRHMRNPIYRTQWPSQGAASGETELRDGKSIENRQTAQYDAMPEYDTQLMEKRHSGFLEINYEYPDLEFECSTL